MESENPYWVVFDASARLARQKGLIMAKKQRGINPDLEKAISELLKAVMDDPEATLIDKMRVLDRALNLEKIKQKVSDDDFGSGFLSGDEEE